MAKNNDQGKKNLTYKQADFQAKDSNKGFQDVKIVKKMLSMLIRTR